MGINLRAQNQSIFPLQSSDESSATSVFTETNTVTVAALTPGSIYAFQIRARNERGFGPYSNSVYFSTLAIGTDYILFQQLFTFHSNDLSLRKPVCLYNQYGMVINSSQYSSIIIYINNLSL